MSWVYLVPGIHFTDLRVGKQIGAGREGHIYEAHDKTRTYALKRERIAKQSKPLEHEIDFATSFANKQPDFMHLYAYRILKDDPWQLEARDIKSDRDRKLFAAKAKLPYVVEKVYTLVHAININSMHPVDFALNVLEKIQRMRKAGWAHRDLHGGNILTTAKGPVIVDYSLVIHKSQVSEDTWKRDCNDYDFVPDWMYWTDLWSHVKKMPPFKNWIKELRKHPDKWKEAVRLAQCRNPPDVVVGRVGALLFAQMHQDFVLGRKMELLPMDLYLDMNRLAPLICSARRADYAKMRRLLAGVIR